MVPLKIPKTYAPNIVLVVDDEREHIEFLIDFMIAKGFEIEFAENVSQAFEKAERNNYRAYFIDLNIPQGFAVFPDKYSDMYQNYRGLQVIRAVRAQGNDGARVVAYSAHFNQGIIAEVESLYCKYVSKGSAAELKRSIEQILSHDPRAAR